MLFIRGNQKIRLSYTILTGKSVKFPTNPHYPIGTDVQDRFCLTTIPMENYKNTWLYTQFFF